MLAFLGLVMLLAGLFFGMYIPTQSDFALILMTYAISFVGYLLLVKYGSRRLQVGAIIVAPVLLLFGFPNFSDDIYRFIWDGYCTINGISPYAIIPSQLALHTSMPDGLLESMNSPDYYSIYPTVSQLFFACTVLVSDHIFIQAMVLKTLYLIIHLVGFWALWQSRNYTNLSINASLYFLNPLVLLEGVGNLHSEVTMAAFLFGAFYLWTIKKHVWSGVLFAVAINIKLIPIFLLGYFLFRWKDQGARRFFISTCIATILLLMPVIYGLLSGGFVESIDLYFRKFEFNASVYYLLRSLGHWISGYNLIQYLGPALFVIFVSSCFYYWYKERELGNSLHFIKTSVFIWTLYFVCSTTIHPWYLIGLLALNTIVQVHYIVIWSFLITWTYINYSYIPYDENLWVVLLEYLIVGSVWWFWDKRVRQDMSFE